MEGLAKLMPLYLVEAAPASSGTGCKTGGSCLMTGWTLE